MTRLAYGAPATRMSPPEAAMVEMTQIWLLIAGATLGVAVGLWRAFDDVQCPCCRLHATRSESRCPYCHCVLDQR